MRYLKRSLLAVVVIAGVLLANSVAQIPGGLAAGLLIALAGLVALVASRLQAALAEPRLMVGDRLGHLPLRLDKPLNGDRDAGELGDQDAAAAEQRRHPEHELDNGSGVHSSPALTSAL